jgi:3-oxo-5-alpha-steroid 4-dehydrogenase 1
MNSLPFFHAFLATMAGTAVVVFCALFFVDAGYGQYVGPRWGKAISDRAGWVIMEAPVVIVFAAYWLTSKRMLEFTPLVFFLLFNLHYLHRTLVFPLLIRGTHKMPWVIVVFGMLFNVANAYMQGAWIFVLSPETLYTPAWLTTPQFLGGVMIFLTGFIINVQSDHILRGLRQSGDTGFHVPRAGLFKYVTAANYLGELTEWIGWAILTWSEAGFVFALWTFANLAPRANRHHRWYMENFGGAYPRDRWRMIPFVY